MTDQEPFGTPKDPVDKASGLPVHIDPGSIDLGDDAERTATNRGSNLDHRNNQGMEGGLDPGNTDLGPDVYRDR